jgi:hypothetical protein
MLRTWPLYLRVSGCASRLYWRQYLRLGWVGVQVNALEVENVILGVVAVVQRVVARNGERVVEGDRWASKERVRRGSRKERGGNGKELHVVLCLLYGVYQCWLTVCLESGVCCWRLDTSSPAIQPASRNGL